jgi:hypothetical protein
MEKLKDADIRSALIQMLRLEHADDNDTIIINELGVLHGQTRVDVAVINGIIHGFEIKSECDTLHRLENQMKDYNMVFDRMTIVVAEIFLEKVKEIVPRWWGIVVVKNKNGVPVLRPVRKGRKNSSVDPFSLVHFLWKDEAIDVLKEKGLHRGYLSKPKSKIYEHLVENVSLYEIKSIVNHQLKSRQGWRDPIKPVRDGGLLQQ